MIRRVDQSLNTCPTAPNALVKAQERAHYPPGTYLPGTLSYGVGITCNTEYSTEYWVTPYVWWTTYLGQLTTIERAKSTALSAVATSTNPSRSKCNYTLVLLLARPPR